MGVPGPPMGFNMQLNRPPMAIGMGMGGPGQGGPRQPFQAHYSRPPKRDVPTGPPVTVFVGNITERAPDAMVRHLLTTCGPVVSWKRVQGATGKLQAFGFCEYSNPDAGLRAIRLLNSYTIADKALVVKVDAKTKKLLEEYIVDRIKKSGDDIPIPSGDEMEGYTDEDMKYEDNLAGERIGQILTDHSKEIESYVPKEPVGLPVAREAPPAATLLQRMGTRDEGLDDVEEEKKGIIHREIDKFRETMKIREAEKEELEKKRGERKSPGRRPRSTSREPSRGREVSRGRESRDTASRGRDVRGSSQREVRERGTRRSRSRGDRRSVVSRSRSRSPVRFERDRGRGSRDRDGGRETRSQREIFKEREMEEEEKERKRAERKAREKEANYQERLRAWETRETKKGKEYEKERLKEKKKVEEMEREGRKLKEFLEDYDDERDDPKFYKGRELQRRLADREREAGKDGEDRRRELDEIEELKAAIYSDPKLSDPATEFQRRLQERERMFLPDKAKRSTRTDSTLSQRQQHTQPNSANSPITLDADSPSPDRGPSPMEDYDVGNIPEPEEEVAVPEPTPTPPALPTIHKTKVEAPKRKKLPVADIFNQEEEEESDKPKKKMKPLPIATSDKKDNKSADDKRKHIKSLIEKIPTDKGDLFAYNIDWDLVDNQLMEKRIRPWVHKKIAEYIGEPEPTLTDFICSKVLAGSEPKAILEDVQMVLDEEAEVFVVKMWRLLIYEIENKKQKNSGGK